ncbi:MAG: hypothetical protein R3D61_02430 [Defluviimonas denitrificans]
MAGVACIALRVSFTGDLGWELHCAEADQQRLYTAFWRRWRPTAPGLSAAAR